MLLINGRLIFGDQLTDPLDKSPVDYHHVKVEKVFSPDSLLLENREKVRLIGLKAPAVSKRVLAEQKFKDVEYRKDILSTSPIHIPENTVDPQVSVATRAYQFAEELLEGKQVRLEFDVQTRDRDFYTLAYVYLPDGTFVNQEILRHGYGLLNIVPPNTKHAGRLREAYQESRREKRGLQSE